jgi:hypothetical protein
MSNYDDSISSIRFSNLEMDDEFTSSEPAAAPEPTPEEAEADLIAKRGTGWGSVGVSQLGAERAKADEVAAIEAGFAVAPPIYEIGSLVNSTGVGNFKASREAFEAMPTTLEACEKLAQQVQAEKRVDITIPLSQLRMLPDGKLTRGTGNGMPITERALSGLGAHVTPGGAGYLRKCPPELRAVNVNHWCEANALKEDGRATNALMREWNENGRIDPQPAPVMVPREIKLRTRVNERQGGREGFALVSPGYSAHDIDAIAEQVMNSPAIPGDARADIVYDGYKARIDVLFHSNVQPERVVAGEMFKAGIMLKTADDGSGSIQIAAQVWRNLCLNLLIIDHAKDMVIRRSHRGSGLDKAVEDGIMNAMKKVAHFADKWSEATLENVLEKYDFQDADQVFRGLVYNKVVAAPGVKPAEMVARLRRAWEMEPGYQRTNFVNAVTRAAHENPWSKWETVENLETLGGQLLYQPVWNVQIPEDVDIAALGY